jgi:hypothetical protein
VRQLHHPLPASWAGAKAGRTALAAR